MNIRCDDEVLNEFCSLFRIWLVYIYIYRKRQHLRKGCTKGNYGREDVTNVEHLKYLFI